MTEIRTAWRDIAARLGASGAPTPLLNLPLLAERCGVAQVLVKDESQRPLGNFKVLGGVYAGLRALARHIGKERIDALFAPGRPALPILICASDGNHGLAVATGARLAGTSARVYLHTHVPASRAQRITDTGAAIVRIDGSYDDAVDEAAAAAARGEGLLIADTAATDDDPVVADVMGGYRNMAEEIAEQLAGQDWPHPTHLFLQAGVGGFAAAMAEGLSGLDRPLPVIVEPENVACVGAALRTGRIKRLSGELETAAEMLCCGEASEPALRILLEHHALAVTVSEDEIERAVDALRNHGGPLTTPSGATGLAGLIAAASVPELTERLRLDAESRVLLFATEGPVAAG